jgi:hypothetical protein
MGFILPLAPSALPGDSLFLGYANLKMILEFFVGFAIASHGSIATSTLYPQKLSGGMCVGWGG